GEIEDAHHQGPPAQLQGAAPGEAERPGGYGDVGDRRLHAGCGDRNRRGEFIARLREGVPGEALTPWSPSPQREDGLPSGEGGPCRASYLLPPLPVGGRAMGE